MAGLPTVTANALKANAEIAARQETAGGFTTTWIEEMCEEQPMMASFIVEMCDSFFEEAEHKVKCVCVAGIVVNAIKASIEAKELEELFTETA
tara:strand:+ start:75 stop:353 length:279 start_codon:yes stop_codon:yes gene_type:complete